MQRGRTILFFVLRYAPLALCASLIVIWIASLFSLFGWNSSGTRQWIIAANHGSIRWAMFDDAGGKTPRLLVLRNQPRFKGCWGAYEFEFAAWSGESSYGYPQNISVVMIPIPWLLTALLPAAIGPFWNYRFPLWSWFAWIALICAEATFYNRLQWLLY